MVKNHKRYKRKNRKTQKRFKNPKDVPEELVYPPKTPKPRKNEKPKSKMIM